ncbi:Lethal(2) giant larvae sro7 [Coemansia sp. RSA 1939]|nr:Lethal(2) giant larvae sro7 [Coemansia sp. RSA 1939]
MKRATPNLSVKLNRVIDPTDDATAIVFEPVQSITAIGYVSGKIRLFSEKLSTHVELGIERSSEIRHLVVLSSQPVVAAIDGLGTLWVFDTDIQRLCFSYNVPLAPTCVGLIADTSWLLIGTEAGRVYFVDVLEGKKSDFSIGCQIRPPSPVVSVAPHPLETEKLLIAYSEGTCVVCDLGKASGSEKAMVLTRHKYEHLQTQGETDGPASAADVDSGAAMLQTTQDGQRSQRDSVHGYANIGSELTSATSTGILRRKS